MEPSLWKFNERTLKTNTKELPDGILKEQADILSDKTGGVLYGRTTNMKFRPQDPNVKYNLATVFDVVVPSLDNYSYTLLIMYSRPESDYPIALTSDSNIIDDAENFRPQYECEDRVSFIKGLREILSSDEVNRNIEILYSKACF